MALTRLRSVALVAVICGLSAGCSASSRPGPPSPSIAAATATVAQWRTLVGPARAALLQHLAGLSACGDVSVAQPPAAPVDAAGCAAQHDPYAQAVQAFASTVQAGATPGDRAYLGTPPAELDSLIQRTVAAGTQALPLATTAYAQACGSSTTDQTDCAIQGLQWLDAAWSALDTVEEWAPYAS